MQQFFLSFAAVSGFIAIALGAFVAHGLKHFLDSAGMITFRTAVDYQMYHALALLIVSLLSAGQLKSPSLKLSGIAFAMGSLLFSGSLYALALGGPTVLGIITPFGGLSFLVGWVALAVYAYRL